MDGDQRQLPLDAVKAVVGERAERLLAMQRDDGHIVFELEADATIPSEYLLLRHFLGEVDAEREAQIARYLRTHQNEDGSWPLFTHGAGDISATIKAYWALKLSGEDIAAPHMARAREFVLAEGGAAKANVFTRIQMALFGQIPWRGIPVIPVEVMLLPRWFPFHMSKIAYWSRTVLTPLLILTARRARGVNPTGMDIAELFAVPPEAHGEYQINPTGTRVGDAFLTIDRLLRLAEPYFPKKPREAAVKKAEAFILSHLNGQSGLGAIYPAMANAVMALRVLGYKDDDEAMLTARDAVERLIVEREDGVYFQPCVSPVWDTGLSAHALMEAGHTADPKLEAMLDWLADKQILEHKGDWTVRRPDIRPGGWAFQYDNPDYPDVDDTAVVAMAMHRHGAPKYAYPVERACEWIVGMQSNSGGWGAFEPENEHFYLNSIPFADHGALLDPPTVDVTARCVGCLAQVDKALYADAIAKGIEYIKSEQEEDGSWFGRWGANYIYGTWSVLVALKGAGQDMEAPFVRRAADWLKAQQREDGGFGEGLETYEESRRGYAAESTASQTAWALLGLIAAGEAKGEIAARAAAWLAAAPKEADTPRWEESFYTGTGFPKVFYLKYHGYSAFFPTWALGRYAHAKTANDDIAWGM